MKIKATRSPHASQKEEAKRERAKSAARPFQALLEKRGEGEGRRGALAAREALADHAGEARAGQEHSEGEQLDTRRVASKEHALTQDAELGLKHKEAGASQQRHTRGEALRERHEDRLTERRGEGEQARATQEQDQHLMERACSPSPRRETRPRQSEEEGGASAESLGEALASPSDSALAPEVQEAGSTPAQALERLVSAIVDACHVGKDQKMRKVMMLDITVPGRGKVRVRLRREGHGVSVRMRADGEGLRALLRGQRAGMLDAARERGVRFSQLEIV